MGITRGQWKLAPLGVEIGDSEERPAPARGVFVTGTGTEVGKTVVAAALARTLAADGTRVAVFKPALTGMDEFPAYDEAAAIAAATAGAATPSVADLPDHAVLRVAAGSSQPDAEIAPYRFGPPMSPHLAAGLAGEEIDPERVMATARAAAADAEFIVCEGVGGLLVPLAPDWSVRSCAVELGHPLLVVSPPGLGAINHTLLTVEAARSVGLEIAAIVLNPWPPSPATIEADNRETITALAGAPVLTLPQLDLAHPDTWPELRLPA